MSSFVFSPHDSLKIPTQTDPSGPNGTQKKIPKLCPGTFGPEFEEFVRISYEFVGNSYEIRTNFVRIWQIPTKLV